MDSRAKGASQTRNIHEFDVYLTKIGIEPPAEMPLIGIGKGKEIAYSWTCGEQLEPIKMGTDLLTPTLIRQHYAKYIFDGLFGYCRDDRDHGVTWWMAEIYAEYFALSSVNGRGAQGNRLSWNGWVFALWDIRALCGQDFTDTGLVLASKSREQFNFKGFDPKNFGDSFNSYFYHRVFIGFEAVDNENEHGPQIASILKKYSLFPK